MKYIALIVVFGFLAVSTFGFAGMSHGSMGCDSVATSMTADDCPTAMISMALHHISAYTGFSGVTFSYSTAILLSVLFSAIATASIFKKLLLPDRSLVLSRLRIRDGDDSLSAQRRKTLGWISLFENSPSL